MYIIIIIQYNSYNFMTLCIINKCFSVNFICVYKQFRSFYRVHKICIFCVIFFHTLNLTVINPVINIIIFKLLNLFY